MFLSLFRANADDRSPWGDFWFSPVPMRTAAGINVSQESALRLSAVYAAVRVKTQSFALLPYTLFHLNDKRVKVRDTKHWLYQRIAKRPNAYQNPFMWREMMQAHLELRGNAYNLISSRGDGTIDEFLPLPPGAVKIEMLSGGNYRYRVRQADGTEVPVPRENIWHLRNLSLDGIIGLSTLELAREAIALSLSVQEYGLRFFANDARPSGGWIEFPGRFADDAAKKVFRESWASMQAGENRGKTAVLEAGMKYHAPDMTNEDMQFLETKKASIADIARFFGVPLHKLAELDRSTNNNIEHQSLEFVIDTMMPIAGRWSADMQYQFIADDDDLEMDFDLKILLRGDHAARGEYIKSRFNSGSITPNDIRISEGDDPSDEPAADQLFVPLNMVPIDKAGQLPSRRKADGAAPADNNATREVSVLLKGEGVPSEDYVRDKLIPALNNATDEGAMVGASEKRLDALIESNARRLARRFAKQGIGATDIKLIAEAFAITEERVNAWLGSTWIDRDVDEQTLATLFIQLGKNYL